MFPVSGSENYRQHDYDLDYQRDTPFHNINQTEERTMRDDSNRMQSSNYNDELSPFEGNFGNNPESGYSNESSSLAQAYERRQRYVENQEDQSSNSEYNHMFGRRNQPMATSYYNHDPLSVADPPLLRNPDNFTRNAPQVMHNADGPNYTNPNRHMEGNSFYRRPPVQSQPEKPMTFSEYLKKLNGSNASDKRSPMKSIDVSSRNESFTNNQYWNQSIDPDPPSPDYSRKFQTNSDMDYRLYERRETDAQLYQQKKCLPFTFQHQDDNIGFIRDRFENVDRQSMDINYRVMQFQNSSFTQPDVVQVNPNKSILKKTQTHEVKSYEPTRQKVIPPSCHQDEIDESWEEEYISDEEFEDEEIEFVENDDILANPENISDEIEPNEENDKDERLQNLHNRFLNLRHKENVGGSDLSEEEDSKQEESEVDSKVIPSNKTHNHSHLVNVQHKNIQSHEVRNAQKLPIQNQIKIEKPIDETTQYLINPFAIRRKSIGENIVLPRPIQNEKIDIFEPVEKEIERKKLSSTKSQSVDKNQHESVGVKNTSKETAFGENNTLNEMMAKENMDREIMMSKQKIEEKREREKMAKERIGQERIAKEKIERERVAKEKLEMKKVVKERMERERMAKEKIERERVAMEKIEMEKLAKEKMDNMEKEILQIDKLTCQVDPLPKKRRKNVEGKFVAFVDSKKPISEDTIREIEIERELLKIRGTTYKIKLDYEQIGMKIVEDSAKQENEKVKKSLSRLDEEINQSVQLIKEWEAVKLFEKQKLLAKQAEIKKKREKNDQKASSTSQLFNKAFEKVKSQTSAPSAVHKTQVQRPPPPKINWKEKLSEDEVGSYERERQNSKDYKKELNELSSATQLNRKRSTPGKHELEGDGPKEKTKKGYDSNQGKRSDKRSYSSSDSDDESREKRIRVRKTNKERDRIDYMRRNKSPSRESRHAKDDKEGSSRKRSTSQPRSSAERIQREPQVKFVISDEDTTTPRITRVLKEDSFKEVTQTMHKRGRTDGRRNWESYYEDYDRRDDRSSPGHSSEWIDRDRSRHHSSYVYPERNRGFSQCDRTAVSSDKPYDSEKYEYSSKRSYSYGRDELEEDDEYVPLNLRDTTKMPLYTLPKYGTPGRGTGRESSCSYDSDPVPCDISDLKRESHYQRGRLKIKEEVTLIPRVSIDPNPTSYSRRKGEMFLLNEAPQRCENCGKMGFHRSVDCWHKSKPDRTKIYRKLD